MSRIRETGNNEIHLIGFSLGAHVTNYVSTTLRSEFIIPRISGLDPAMPLFVTADADNKLDASDAAFVDVIHTNALVQGKIEQCGHVDFYLNGGVHQPGCNSGNIFQCSHHRAPEYYAESINSAVGFWGWKCQSYVTYLFGMCTPEKDQQAVAGEDCRASSSGLFFLKTNPSSPFATGRLTVVTLKNSIQPFSFNPVRNVDPFLKQIDAFGKLEGNFNNMAYQKPIDEFIFFSEGSNELAHNFVDRLRHGNKEETKLNFVNVKVRKSSKLSKYDDS